jgi:hypothetical protein
MPRKIDHDRLREELLRRLAVEGPSTVASSISRLGISQPTFSRLVASMRDDILVVGRARATRYAARRTVPTVGRTVPVYEIDESGRSRLMAVMHAKKPEGFWVESRADDVQGGFYDDLPWFLHDLKPSGYLGRLVPRRHPELELPDDIRMWTADHCLAYLTRYGSDSIGSLVLGEKAFKLYLDQARTATGVVHARERETRYPQIAEDVLGTTPAGSSAAGEQPKFLATVDPGRGPVIVKFSPPVSEASGRRLADLLVCEHLVHEVLGRRRVPAARSEILRAGGRVFLEVQRFDRVGGGGRRGLVSLTALDAEFMGSFRGWSDTARGLAEQGLVDTRTVDRVAWLECFGSLIGNDDMHHGNLSFLTRGTGVVDLAPSYDMSPSKYAPRAGRLPDDAHRPGVPGPSFAGVWTDAFEAARDLWREVAAHPLVSEGFRGIARINLDALEEMKGVERLLPGRG